MRDVDLAAYIADNYGGCELGQKCACLKGEWRGTGCPYWRPVKARTWDELKGELK